MKLAKHQYHHRQISELPGTLLAEPMWPRHEVLRQPMILRNLQTRRGTVPIPLPLITCAAGRVDLPCRCTFLALYRTISCSQANRSNTSVPCTRTCRRQSWGRRPCHKRDLSPLSFHLLSTSESNVDYPQMRWCVGTRFHRTHYSGFGICLASLGPMRQHALVNAPLRPSTEEPQTEDFRKHGIIGLLTTFFLDATGLVDAGWRSGSATIH